MKKYGSIVACLGLTCLIMCGCGANSTVENDVIESENVEKTETSEKTLEYVALDDATITMPAGLIGTEVSSEDIASVDDTTGNVTYDLSGSDRSDIVNNLAQEIYNSIDTILADKSYYPNIESITPNDDFTEFTIAVSGGQVNMYESMLTMSFYTVGNKYQIYMGVSAEDALTTVKYVNAETGEVIAQSDSSSMVVQ